MKNKLTDFTYSPPGISFRKDFPSPQLHSRRSTEGVISDRQLYSPESTVKHRTSPRQHYLHPQYQPEFDMDQQNRSQSNRDYIPISPSFETLMPKSQTHRKESNNYLDDRSDNGEYDYLRVPKQFSNETQRTNIIESKGRNIRAEIENLRQQEFLLRQKNYTKDSFFTNNMTKSGVTIPSADALSVGGRIISSPSHLGGNSRAYAKAMRALQDRVVALEEQNRALEHQKKEGEMRCAQLEENFVKIQQQNLEEAKTAKDIDLVKNQLLEQIERLQREKEVFLREKEESIREKEQLMSEKEDWMRAKEILEKTIYEKEREKDEAEKKNAPLAENLQKLEKDFAEYKKMYHQHLKSIVLKNEGLVLELSQMKEYYDVQITDFEKELSLIEEENKKKTDEYESTIDGLTKRNKELEELYVIKQKEVESLKAQKLGSPRLDESVSRRVYSVPDEDRGGPNYESILKSLSKYKKLSSAEKKTENPENQNRRSANNSLSRIQISSFFNNNERASELNELLESRKSPTQYSRTIPQQETPQSQVNGFDSIIKGRRSEKGSSGSLAGLLTPPAKALNLEALSEKVERLSKTVSNEDHRKEPLETIQEKQDEDIRSYLEPAKFEDHHEVYIESEQNLQNFHKQDDFVNVVYDKLENVETAGFPKNLSFGNADMFSSRANSLESSGLRNSGPIGSSFKVFNARKSYQQDLGAIRAKLLDKERDLAQVNKQYEELKNKIQESQNSIERSKMRSELIDLTNTVQKINEEISLLKRQEASSN